MGRPRKPTEMKRRAGTLQKCRVLADEMQTPAGEPPMPEGLDPIAVECWRRVVPQLLAAGVLSVIDREALEGLCVSYSAAVRYGRLAVKEPLVETFRGVAVNPAAKESRAQWAIVKQLATEFGLTAASRSKISGAGKKPEDKAAEFLFSGAPAVLKVVK